MKLIIASVAATWLAASACGPRETNLAQAVAEHDRHPGLGHPAGDEGNHEHGDSDDHHKTPESPCHHHDTHSCCTQGPTLALIVASMDLEPGNATRIPVPKLQAFARFSVVEFLHVPIA